MPGVAMAVDVDSQRVVRARMIGVRATSTAMSMTRTGARTTTYVRMPLPCWAFPSSTLMSMARTLMTFTLQCNLVRI
jgi:hypothetical protein